MNAKPANSKKESVVTVYTTRDDDNVNLIYTLNREDGTKLAAKTLAANWWAPKSWTYTDKNVPAGTSLQYQLVVTDPYGNATTYNDTTLIDDTDSRIKYSGSGWNAYTKRADTSPDFGRTIHRLSKNGSYMMMTFTGTSITMFNEMNSYSGEVDVSIDGGPASRYDLNYDNGKGYKKF